MPECDNPLWPCAMTGAAACLAGFEGVSVVIHGSSGCYFYPATLLHAPLHGTFIVEEDVVFGSEERLVEVVSDLSSHKGTRVAVITTCVPAILGEDIRAMLSSRDVMLVDSPGFSGQVEAGYGTALSVIGPRTDPGTAGVNIDGACLFDPFSRGNVQEIRRLLGVMSVPVGTVFSQDSIVRAWNAAPYTIGTNADFDSGVGRHLGGTLGLDELRATVELLGDTFPGSDIGPVLSEIGQQDERIVHACDKFLKRSDPPSVAVFAGSSYAGFAAGMLKQYLDADIRFIGTRNEPVPSTYPSEQVTSLSEVAGRIGSCDPDLVIGSSFERSVAGDRMFLGIIPPLRGRVRLAPRALAGITGSLSFMEDVLNVCMDKKAEGIKNRRF